MTASARVLSSLTGLTTAVLMAAGLGVGLGVGMGAGLAPGEAFAGTGPHAAAARQADVHLDLPDGFQPEGIATGPRMRAYLGSRVDGDVYQLNLRTGQGRVISQGPGTPSLGMKLDGRGRLFVAGGTGGDARVIDVRSGAVLASYPLVTGSPAFINDVVLTRRAAYFTDSASAQLFRVPLGRHGGLPTAARVSSVPLTGDWLQNPDAINANGITTTPDGRALLVVNSSTGLLYRVAFSGRATAVDLHGASLANGDGLLREGRRLFAVQNVLNQIAVVRLSQEGATGRVRHTITSPDFDVPTTVARAGDRLYLPNARFTTPATPETEYWVTGLAVG